MTRYLIGDKFIAMPYASYIIGILTITIRTISVPDSLRDSVGEHVGEMARLWRLNMARRLQTHGLSFPQWAVLRTLAGRGDGMVQRDLADAIGVDGSTLVGILDRLAKAELVERRENAQDRRFKRVHLGPPAHALLPELETIHLGLRQELYADIPEDDLEVCLRVLSRAVARARVSGEPST